MTGYITIRERWYRDRGERKIGDGPWKPIDLSVYGGRVPVVFLNDRADWVETEKWVDPAEASR